MKTFPIAALILLLMTGCTPMYTTHFLLQSPSTSAHVNPDIDAILTEVDTTAAEFKYQNELITQESANDGWLRNYWLRDPGYPRQGVAHALLALQHNNTIDIAVRDIPATTQSPLSARLRRSLEERLIKRFGKNSLRTAEKVEHGPL